ncbi:hypothetical protein [Tenacibaculum sp. SDUM215027]|uniref:hypothetical protein n=1 Tax=Tenacibaculum sp. SDUM215027 TaxID=3422596 RepID=UPI003D31DF99
MNKKLSILKPEKSKEELKQERLYSGDYVSFSKQFGTSLRGYQYTRTYSVAIDLFDVQKDKSSKVQFEAEVTIRKFPELGYYEYSIKKDNIFINKRYPKTLIEKLSVITSEVLYPLEVQTTLSNELLDIINHKEILERWKKIKVQLQREYTGNAIDQYITKFEAKLHQKYRLLHSLNHEIFYTLLFQDIYTKYDDTLEKKATINFPVLGFKTPINFKGNQKINKKKTYYNTALACFESHIESGATQATLNVENDLDGNTFLLENIIAKCTIKNNKTVIKTVNASIYHLKEKPTIRRSFKEMRDDIRRRHRKIRKEKNKELTLKQRFIKWLDN